MALLDKRENHSRGFEGLGPRLDPTRENEKLRPLPERGPVPLVDGGCEEWPS